MYQVQNASPGVVRPIVPVVFNATDAETYEQSIEKIKIQFKGHYYVQFSKEFFTYNYHNPSNKIIRGI